MKADTAKLYAYLAQTGGICTLAHLGDRTRAPTGPRRPIPSWSRSSRLFQGFHASFEAPGARGPSTPRATSFTGSYKPDGYVSQALDKGYRLGFQASSDHVSTHVSYACVLAEEFSRKGLIDGDEETPHLRGDRQHRPGRAHGQARHDGRRGVAPTKPSLDVVVLGTGPIERVDVIRNGEVVHAEKPEKDAAEVRFHWEDPDAAQGRKPSYYYVRVVCRRTARWPGRRRSG